MGDSITPNPWRPDPSGGLVYQDLELRHGQGSVVWTDEDGTAHTRLSSNDTDGLLVQADALRVEATEATIGGQLIIDGAGDSSFVRSAHGTGNFQLRAGYAVIDVATAYVPANGARDYAIALGGAAVPDYVIAQITDGGSLYYGFTLAGTGNYRSAFGIPHFDATVQSHLGYDVVIGHLWINYIAVYLS